VLAAALAARYLWIEPFEYGEFCRANEATLACRLRAALIASFAFNGIGYAALLVGALSLFIRRFGLALAGACLGVAGLVLYCYDYAAIGFLLSVLTLARVTAPARGDEFGQQHGEREDYA